MRKLILVSMFLALLCGCNIKNENLLNRKMNISKLGKEDTIQVSNVSLSNETIAWGFRRMKNGAQPEFSSSYTSPLNKFKAIYIGNKEEKYVYLTFDEGYENGYTSVILDTLKDKGVNATFFVTMPYVKQNPELVERMIKEGHIVRKSYGKSSKYAIGY